MITGIQREFGRPRKLGNIAHRSPTQAHCLYSTAATTSEPSADRQDEIFITYKHVNGPESRADSICEKPNFSPCLMDSSNRADLPLPSLRVGRRLAQIKCKFSAFAGPPSEWLTNFPRISTTSSPGCRHIWIPQKWRERTRPCSVRTGIGQH